MSIPDWFWHLTPDDIHLGLACSMDTFLADDLLFKRNKVGSFAFDSQLRAAAELAVENDFDMVKTKLMLAP